MQWDSKRKSTKLTSSSEPGLNFEMTGRVSGASVNISPPRKHSTVLTLKAAGKKTRGLSPSTVMLSALDATNSSTNILKNTRRGNSLKRGKRFWMNLLSHPTPIRKRTELQRFSIGLKNCLRKPIFCLGDIIVVVLLAIAFIWIKNRLILGWK